MGHWSLPTDASQPLPAPQHQQQQPLPPAAPAAVYAAGLAQQRASGDVRQSADMVASGELRLSSDTRRSRLSVSIDPGDLPLSQLGATAAGGGGGGGFVPVAVVSGGIPLACGA